MWEFSDVGLTSVWPSGKAKGPRFDTASALLSLEKKKGLWFVDTVL